MEEYLNQEDIDEEIDLDGDEKVTALDDDDDNNSNGDDDDDYCEDVDQIQDEPDVKDSSLEVDGGQATESLVKPLSEIAQHKEPVLTVAISKSGEFAMSGGQDDIAHVWDTKTGSTISSCQDHKDSVIGVGFNCSDSMVASCDMSGLIQVWKVPSGEKVFEYEVDEILWLSWHPVVNIALLVGTISGAVWMFNVSDSSKIKTMQSGSSGCCVARVTSCGNKLLAGYEDGSLRLWDLKTGNVIHTIKNKMSHQSTVTCIDFRGDDDDSLAATSSTDGNVKITNLSSGKIVCAFICGKVPDFERKRSGGGGNDYDTSEQEECSVESVKFSPTSSLIATATVSGIIEVWEVSNFTRRCYFIHEGGVSTIAWHPIDAFKLVSAGLDGCVNVWDARSGRQLSQRCCHRDQILDMKVFTPSVPAGASFIVTASEDTTCKVIPCNTD